MIIVPVVLFTRSKQTSTSSSFAQTTSGDDHSWDSTTRRETMELVVDTTGVASSEPVTTTTTEPITSTFSSAGLTPTVIASVPDSTTTFVTSKRVLNGTLHAYDSFR